MRIGIDARELCGQSTGVGRYLGGLLREWTTDERARSHEFVLYAPQAIALPLDSRRFPTRTIAGAGGTWWEQVQLPRSVAGDHLDVWFAPAYTAPIGIGAPTVVAIHDLSFVAHPEWFSIREGARRRWLTRQSAARAASVITISEFSRNELVERLGVPDDKIHVIPPGIAATMASASSSRARSSSGPIRVLFVGSVFNRRHVTDLIRAFAPIARTHADAALDLVGDDRTFPRENLRHTIAAEQLDSQVRWHEYVTDEHLSALYSEARAFAFLSEYEGLGLTPLEAMANGVPPVLLDTPVARESCDGAAVYVGVNDLPATTRALESVLFDEGTRTRMLDAAPAVLARYNWPRAARDTLEVLERAARTERS